MVSTRSKAKRASTPLSSPPASPTPRLSGSSAPDSPLQEVADDVAVSIKADSQYGSSDSDDGFDSDHDSDSDHEDHCSRHTSGRAMQCNGRTYANQPCKNKGRIAKEGHFPVCGKHLYYQKQAGRCQAIEKCGYPCNRLAAYTPPFFFCTKHEHDASTFPCHIMRIPTELRLMIFRFLLPKRVEAKDYFDKRPFGVLRANRQFYEEASAVVYSEIRFTAAVFPTCIDLFGRRWHRESTTEPYKDLNTTLCQAGARRVRHLEIHIHFGDTHKTIKGVGGASLPYEEYEIYQARDTVRKLVQLMSPEPLKSKSKALQHLKVMAKPAPKQSWQIDEIIAAIFCILDPLLALGPIDDCVLSTPLRPNVWGWRYGDWARLIGEVHQDEAYRRLRKQWLGSIRGSSSQFIVTRNPTAAAVEAYNKVEDFSRLVYNQDAAQSRGKAQFKHGWTGSAFRGIERVLHIARVAYEDGQLETLQSIHQAIMRRWVKTHAQHVLSFTAVANTVSDMFEDVSTVDGYDSKAFDFEQATSSKEALKDDDMWSELEVKRIALERLYNPGTTVKEKGARVKVCTDDGQRVYLKTPSVARQLREYKRRKEQMP